MKKFLLILLLGISLGVSAQEECKYSEQSAKGETPLKTTTEYLMHEKTFGNTSTYIFFSLTNSDGVPILNFQLLAKSKDFPKIYCLDRASKIYLQLSNGKIVTLINGLDEHCSGLIYDDKEKNNLRVLTSSFLFSVGSLDDLEKYPISFMRIKYATETVDYTVSRDLVSKNISGTFHPETYFINHLKCIQ